MTKVGILFGLGIYLVLDGLFSLIFVSDKNWKWQIARILRILVGLVIGFLAVYS